MPVRTFQRPLQRTPSSANVCMCDVDADCGAEGPADPRTRSAVEQINTLNMTASTS